MKGVVPFFVVVLLLVVAFLGYFNMKHQQTIQLLNEEIFEQARLRHNLLLEKHKVEQKLNKLQPDSLVN